jgi:hypothetical protein
VKSRRILTASVAALALVAAGSVRADTPLTPAQACDKATSDGYYTPELYQQCLDDYADSQD